MFKNDIIKIMYINDGYLPNYPYRMITDAELFEAFIQEDGYFDAMYPSISADTDSYRDALRTAIKLHFSNYLESDTELPYWVYSYMNGSCISVNSSYQDIKDLATLFGEDVDGIEKSFDQELSERCLKESKEWLAKSGESTITRPPTIYGEPHVIKSLRLKDVDVLQS